MILSRYTIYGLDYLSMGYILYLFGFALTQFICILFHSGYLLCIIAQRKQLEFTLPATVSKVIIPFAITTILLNKGFLVLKSSYKFVSSLSIGCKVSTPTLYHFAICAYIYITPFFQFLDPKCDIFWNHYKGLARIIVSYSYLIILHSKLDFKASLANILFSPTCKFKSIIFVYDLG